LISNISPVFTREVQYWGSSISKWAAASNLDPNLAATVMQIESCGDPRALSRSGAIGLFQVMPFHFRITDSPYDPETNAARGLAYLARSLAAAGGDARLALAGYNGGIGVISRAEWAWSAQTRRYVQYGAPIYADARSGAQTSAMVQEWYNRYGRSLCRQAAERIGLP
jgi:soluble lytic murein transglycosylase-like protein